MTDKSILDLYHKEIDKTNNKIFAMNNWEVYQLKFKYVNPKLYNALCKINLRSIKNEYLRNWVKMIRNK